MKKIKRESDDLLESCEVEVYVDRLRMNWKLLFCLINLVFFIKVECKIIVIC